MVRNERTLAPETYMERLPVDLDEDEVVILEIMIATGGSSSAAVDVIRAAGGDHLHLCGVLAAPEGIARLAADHRDLSVTVAAIDEGLDERGFIVPGLGDSGDRLYGLPGA
jgi:uracil phosphoribosyltransferase